MIEDQRGLNLPYTIPESCALTIIKKAQSDWEQYCDELVQETALLLNMHLDRLCDTQFKRFPRFCAQLKWVYIP